MVNAPLNDRRYLWMLLPCAVVLCLAAWLRGAEYDEQYTLFLTAGTPRPDWPETVFAAGLAREFQSGHSGLLRIARDLRATDVHPPLYFWLVSLWRDTLGDGLFVARLFSAAAGVGALALTGLIASATRVPVARAMLLTLGCYGFTYTSVIARGFALAQLLLLGGVACLLLGRRARIFGLAGALFGAATLTNYLAVFVAGLCLAAMIWEATGQRTKTGDAHPLPGTNRGARFIGTSKALAAAVGFLAFIPADLWWFSAQRGSRAGQFPPFELVPALGRLAGRAAGAVLGGLPLYLDGAASMVVGAALGMLLTAAGVCIVWRWRRVATPRARWYFAFAAAATPIGLILLGFIFNNTPIELRYLAFSTPFVALLLAGALGRGCTAVLLAVQTASIAGMLLAPQTMQPAHAAAVAAAAAAEDGVVLVPRGNDGVGVVGAFAIEAPPALPLLVIRGGETVAGVRVRVKSWRRVVLALLEQDDNSRAASDTMRQALAGPDWREVASGSNIAVYERIGGGE